MKFKRRTNPKGCCPVDLMSQIAKEEEGNVVTFNLTAGALHDMCVFPVDKKVSYSFDEKKRAKIEVEWYPSGDTMTLNSFNGNTVFVVEVSDTEELRCQRSDSADVTYLIEAE